MLPPSWGYRIRQLRNAVAEQRQPIAHNYVRAHLTSAGQALFYSMSARDQAHSLNTAELIATVAPDDGDLLAAALLHDAGKGPQRMWERVLYVLLDELCPKQLAQAARPGSDVRGALYRSIRHAQIGSDLARDAGLPEAICDLIAAHHGAATDARLRLLQWADAVADHS